LALEIISEIRDPLDGKSRNEDESQEHHHDHDGEEDTISEEEEVVDYGADKETIQDRIHELNKQKSLISAKQSQKKRTPEDKKRDDEELGSIQAELTDLEEALHNITTKINKRVEREIKIWCQCLDVAIFLLQNTNKVSWIVYLPDLSDLPNLLDLSDLLDLFDVCLCDYV